MNLSPYPSPTRGGGTERIRFFLKLREKNGAYGEVVVYLIVEDGGEVGIGTATFGGDPGFTSSHGSGRENFLRPGAHSARAACTGGAFFLITKQQDLPETARTSATSRTLDGLPPIHFLRVLRVSAVNPALPC